MKRLWAAGAVMMLSSACGGVIEDEDAASTEEVEQALCPAGNYANKGPCFDYGEGPYSGSCPTGPTYSYWQCTKFEATIGGKLYRYRAYCGSQQEGCSRPTPACNQNC